MGVEDTRLEIESYEEGFISYFFDTIKKRNGWGCGNLRRSTDELTNELKELYLQTAKFEINPSIDEKNQLTIKLLLGIN